MNLTKRETEIAILRCDGLTYGEIAAKLTDKKNISIRTVESHLNNAKQKIGSQDCSIQFFAFCLQLGIYPKDRFYQRYSNQE